MPQIREYLDLPKVLPIRVEPKGLFENVDLKTLFRCRSITAHDAAYLDLARRAYLPPATSDGPLPVAAIAEDIGAIE